MNRLILCLGVLLSVELTFAVDVSKKEERKEHGGVSSFVVVKKDVFLVGDRIVVTYLDLGEHELIYEIEFEGAKLTRLREKLMEVSKERLRFGPTGVGGIAAMTFDIQLKDKAQTYRTVMKFPCLSSNLLDGDRDFDELARLLRQSGHPKPEKAK